MNFGPTELIILTSLIVPFGLVFPIWGIVDAAGRPDSAWARAEQNKTLWIVLQAVGMLVCFGWILAVVYLVAIRPKVRAAEGGVTPA
jgi:drug/metabolite transporter superfamily protein YnfA